MDMGQRRGKGPGARQISGAVKALVSDEEAGIVGEIPEAQSPGSSQVGGERMREEGRAEGASALSLALVASACGPSLRTTAAQARARISPQPGLAQLRCFSGQTAPTFGPGGDASAHGGDREGERAAPPNPEEERRRPRNASQPRHRAALRREMLRIHGLGRHTLLAPRLIAKRTLAHPGQGRCTNTGTLLEDTPTHTQTTQTALSHTRLRGSQTRPPSWKGAAQARDTPRKEPSSPLTSSPLQPRSARHSRTTALVGRGGSAHRARHRDCPGTQGTLRGPALRDPAGLQRCWQAPALLALGMAASHSPSCTAWKGLLASMTLME